MRPGCDTSLGRFSYLSVNLNQNPVLAAHTDRSNLGWSWNLALGNYTGGYLWVRSPNGKESPPPGSQNMDWRGRLLNPHQRWIEFDGLVEHGVTESKGYRVSITLFSPRAHSKLHLGHWHRLHQGGFPFLGVLVQRLSMPFRDCRQHAAFERLLESVRGADHVPRYAEAEAGAPAAHVVSTPAGQSTDAVETGVDAPKEALTVEVWPMVADLLRSSPGSDFCIFVNAVFALYGTADSHLPPVCSLAKRVFPLGLPHSDATSFKLAFLGSPRRRQRAQRHHQLHLHENLVACALSWLHLGRPRNGLGADLLYARLNSLQASLWEPFALELRRWCRPLPDLCGEGGGLSRCLSKLISGDDGFGYQAGFKEDRPTSLPEETITLNNDNLALPKIAAQIQLGPPLIPTYVQRILEQPDSFRLRLPPDGLHRVHFAVDNWPSVFTAMQRVGLVTLRPREVCSQHMGRVVKAGLFGVPKKGTSAARIIVDRRAQNHLEHSLRSILALHRDAGLLDDSEYRAIAKHIVLPYAGMFTC
eukprot:6487596-Amphidinium_carterae.2